MQGSRAATVGLGSATGKEDAFDIFWGAFSSRESLNPVIQEHNLYARERARMPFDDVIDKMKQDITVETLPLELGESRYLFS